MKAQAVVCLTAGLTANRLPSSEGWDRVYTAVQLLLDGYADRLVFSGGGTSGLSEAEVYSEAAGWLGVPTDRMLLDPWPADTASHPGSLLKLPGAGIHRNTLLLVVTTPLHSRRVAMTFRHAGFSGFRVVTEWAGRRNDPRTVRNARTSAVRGFQPSVKRYDDVMNRTVWGVTRYGTALRECAAIIWYRLTGRA
jgi:hypothetical protein